MKPIFPVKHDQQSRSRNLALRLAVALGLLIACDIAPVVDPSAFEKPYVFGLLSPAAKQHEIFLAVSQFDGNPKPLDDARVRLSGPAGEITLAAVGKGLYHNSATTLPVIPGQTYRLHIVLRDGREISGATKIPASFRILRPAPGDTFKVDSIGVFNKFIRIQAEWTKAAGSWLMQHAAYFQDANGGTSYGIERPTMSTSESVTLGVPSSPGRIFNSGQLKIVQFDSAYTIYHLTKNFYCYDGPFGNPLPQITCDDLKRLQAAYQNRGINVTGAYGLFGAAVTDSLRFFIKP